jgi:hypothetical protein
LTDKRNFKYCSLMGARTIPENIKRCLEEQPARSGMYNWVFVHKGEVNSFWQVQDELDRFDAVQINCSPIDMSLIPLIRQKLKGSDTKLIINNDYVCEKWGKWDMVNPHQYDAYQRMGDMVFGTEPHQVSNMINGAYCLPHPTNTKCVKRIGCDSESNSVGFIFHWWAGETLLPWRTLERVKAKYGIKKSRIYAYGDARRDEQERWSKIMWDEVMPLMQFPDFAEVVQGEKCVYDPNPCHTYGRNGVELACWKTPVVGSNRVFSYDFLFPELSCDPYDFKATMNCFDTVFKQPKKMEHIMERAYENVEWFNYDNSRERFFKCYDEAIDKGGVEFYGRQH